MILSGFKVIVVEGMTDPDWWQTATVNGERLLFVTPEIKLRLDRLTKLQGSDLAGALGQSHNKES